MQFFKPANNGETLQLLTSSHGRECSIAYGAGSVISGSVILETSQHVQVHQLKVVFQCQVFHDQQLMTNLFCVEEAIPLNDHAMTASSDNRTTVVAAGSHLYLFAIQLPQTNYPPSLTESTFPTVGGTQIRYTIQAFMDYPDNRPTLISNEAPILYLPLVTPRTDTMKDRTATENDAKNTYTMGDRSTLLMKAKLTQSSYCPGDQCTIQLITDNNTNTKINHVYVTFITQCSTDQHIITHQAIPVSIPKQTTNHMTQISVPIARSCLPTFDYDQHGIQIHVAHHIILGLTPSTKDDQAPSSPTSSRFFSLGSFYGNSNFSTIKPLQLPITITTLRTSQPMIVEYDRLSQWPTFISTSSQDQQQNDETGLDRQYSVSPSNSIPMDQDEPRLDGQQTHLTVPTRLAPTTLS